MKLRKENSHERQTLTVLEKRELNMLRHQIVCLEAMYREGILSLQDYNKQLKDIGLRVEALEGKYGLR